MRVCTFVPLYFIILIFSATCGENFYVSDQLQNFSTSNWPDSHPANQDCYWIIQPDGNKGFDINLSEGKTQIEFDFVEVKFTNESLFQRDLL